MSLVSPVRLQRTKGAREFIAQGGGMLGNLMNFTLQFWTGV